MVSVSSPITPHPTLDNPIFSIVVPAADAALSKSVRRIDVVFDNVENTTRLPAKVKFRASLIWV